MTYKLLVVLAMVLVTTTGKSQNSMQVFDWEAQKSFNEDRQSKTAHPLIKDIEGTDFKIQDKKGTTSLRIESPVEGELENVVTLVLHSETAGLLLSIDNYYTLCSGSGCDNKQYIKTFGVSSSGKVVLPEFILNSGNEKYISVSDGRLDIHKVVGDDILVYFETPVSQIVLTNGKTSLNGMFKPFVVVGAIGQVHSGDGLSTLDAMELCSLDYIFFALDASGSMDESDRREAIDVLGRTLETILLYREELAVDIVAYASTGKLITGERSVASLLDIELLKGELEATYLPMTFEGSWTNANAGTRDFINDSKGLNVLITDGISNGNMHQRTSMIDANRSSTANAVTVNISDNDLPETLGILDKDVYLGRLARMFKQQCAQQTSSIEKSHIQILPNPSDGRFHIYGLDSDEWTVTVFNSLNQEVFSSEGYAHDGDPFKLDLSSLSAGHYYIRVASKTSQQTYNSQVIIH